MQFGIVPTLHLVKSAEGSNLSKHLKQVVGVLYTWQLVIDETHLALSRLGCKLVSHVAHFLNP